MNSTEQFSINGNGGSITISLSDVLGFPSSTCHWGGYDVKCLIEIISGTFSVKSHFWTSTFEIYTFYQTLKICDENIAGNVQFINYESNFELNLKYDELGQVEIHGCFSEFNEDENELKYNFNSDQSYIRETVTDLKYITDKYGGNKGVE